MAPFQNWHMMGFIQRWLRYKRVTTLEERLLRRCLGALDMVALASEDWRRPAEKCSAWYELRAELRDYLKNVPKL